MHSTKLTEWNKTQNFTNEKHLYLIDGSMRETDDGYSFSAYKWTLNAFVKAKIIPQSLMEMWSQHSKDVQISW